MIRICICDDDILYSSFLENCILKFTSTIDGLEVDIDIYESGISLTESITRKQESYQILFLDMEMEGMNGIETAREIRKVNKSLYIIYVTSYEKYSIESFEVSPYRYLIKPIDENNIQTVLAQVIEELMVNKQYLFFKYQNAQYQIECDSIIVIKSELSRMIRIILTENNESTIFYGKIKDIEKDLNPLVFVKVNSGTIVNLKHVNIVTNKEIKMNDGNVYPISRGQKQEVKIKYNSFLERRLGL